MQGDCADVMQVSKRIDSTQRRVRSTCVGACTMVHASPHIAVMHVAHGGIHASPAVLCTPQQQAELATHIHDH
jgi:hypothetical protein